MLGNLLEYGERDKEIDTALLSMIILVITLIFIFTSGVLIENQTVENIVSSEYISDFNLAIFRTTCAIICFFTLAWIVLDPKGAPDFPLYFKERKVLPRHRKGLTRLAAYTMWHFGLIGINFLVSATASWMTILGIIVPKWILIISPILFFTSFTSAILVTCVVSFHIIGDAMSRRQNIDHLFYWYEIVMHNFNVIILAIALVINNIEVDWKYFAFPIVFGIMYVIWARIYAIIEGVYIYDFMDPRLNGAPIIYSFLLILQTIFFGIVAFLDWLVVWNIGLGIVGISIGTYSIVTVRNPSSRI